jgi:hypothetical protein
VKDTRGRLLVEDDAEAKPESTEALSSILMSATDPERGDGDAGEEFDRDAEPMLSCLRRIPTSTVGKGGMVWAWDGTTTQGSGWLRAVERVLVERVLKTNKQNLGVVLGKKEGRGRGFVNKGLSDALWGEGGCGTEAALEMQPGAGPLSRTPVLRHTSRLRSRKASRRAGG